MLGKGLCGSFLGSPALPSVSWKLVWASLSPLGSPSRGACVHFSHLTRSALCVTVLVCTCLGSLGLLSVLQACVHLSWLPRPALCVAGLVCSSFGSLGCPLCHEACVHWRGWYAVTLWAPWACPLDEVFQREKGKDTEWGGEGRRNESGRTKG